MRVIKASEPLFGSSALFFTECKIVDVAAWLRDNEFHRAAFDVEDDTAKGSDLASTWESVDELGRPFHFIWLPYFSDTTDRLGNLTHECVHLASDICGVKGVEIEEGKKNETLAYLTEYYFTEFLKREHTDYAIEGAS